MNKMLLLLAVIATLPVIAQSPKEPWMLTVEERVALRTNSELARERVRIGERVRTSRSPSTNAQASRMADDFDGKTHPELFLPYQVFDELVGLAFLGAPRTGEVVRTGLMPEVTRHGLPTDFWQRLQSVSTVYLADNRAVRDLIDAGVRQQNAPARQRTEETLELKHADSCRSRADALAAARKEFGRERFDRFLYEVIATHMFHVSDRLPDPELLRQAERGCR